MKHLKWISIVVLGWVAAGLAIGAPSPKPNIVFILADDLGYGDVHCLNPDRCKIATPCVDRFATQGMTFTEAHSASSVCTPSRYGILTGRYCWRSRLQSNVLGQNDPPLISKDRLTLPALLKQQGYTTGAVGKWHLGWNCARRPDGQIDFTKPITDGPVTRGFDWYYGTPFDPGCFIENDRFLGKPVPVPKGRFVYAHTAVPEYTDEALLPVLTEKACEFIRRQAKGKQPFFLYYAAPAPHLPVAPTAEWRGKSGLGAYTDYVMETDAMIGRVIAAIDETGIAENALVVFASDNGCAPYIGVKKLEQKGHFPSADRRGYKSDIWDGGHRIPLLVRWPGKVTPGTHTDQLVCLNDMLATCADFFGVKLPDNAGEDSVSLLPVLLGKATAPVREAVVYHSIKGNFAIQQGQWKLELCTGSGGWGQGGVTDAPGQLYDMSKDIGERKNEYNQHPEIVVRLTKLLEKYVAEGRSTPGPNQTNDVAVVIHKKEKTK